MVCWYVVFCLYRRESVSCAVLYYNTVFCFNKFWIDFKEVHSRNLFVGIVDFGDRDYIRLNLSMLWNFFWHIFFFLKLLWYLVSILCILPIINQSIICQYNCQELTVTQLHLTVLTQNVCELQYTTTKSVMKIFLKFIWFTLLKQWGFFVLPWQKDLLVISPLPVRCPTGSSFHVPMSLPTEVGPINLLVIAYFQMSGRQELEHVMGAHPTPLYPMAVMGLECKPADWQPSTPTLWASVLLKTMDCRYWYCFD